MFITDILAQCEILAPSNLSENRFWTYFFKFVFVILVQVFFEVSGWCSDHLNYLVLKQQNSLANAVQLKKHFLSNRLTTFQITFDLTRSNFLWKCWRPINTGGRQLFLVLGGVIINIFKLFRIRPLILTRFQTQLLFLHGSQKFSIIKVIPISDRFEHLLQHSWILGVNLVQSPDIRFLR